MLRHVRRCVEDLGEDLQDLSKAVGDLGAQVSVLARPREESDEAIDRIRDSDEMLGSLGTGRGERFGVSKRPEGTSIAGR